MGGGGGDQAGAQCTHPIETAQVLHPVLVTVLVVVDDSMLLVHATGLEGTVTSGAQSHAASAYGNTNTPGTQSSQGPSPMTVCRQSHPAVTASHGATLSYPGHLLPKHPHQHHFQRKCWFLGQRGRACEPLVICPPLPRAGRGGQTLPLEPDERRHPGPAHRSTQTPVMATYS